MGYLAATFAGSWLSTVFEPRLPILIGGCAAATSGMALIAWSPTPAGSGTRRVHRRHQPRSCLSALFRRHRPAHGNGPTRTSSMPGSIPAPVSASPLPGPWRSMPVATGGWPGWSLPVWRWPSPSGTGLPCPGAVPASGNRADGRSRCGSCWSGRPAPFSCRSFPVRHRHGRLLDLRGRSADNADGQSARRGPVLDRARHRRALPAVLQAGWSTAGASAGLSSAGACWWAVPSARCRCWSTNQTRHLPVRGLFRRRLHCHDGAVRHVEHAHFPRRAVHRFRFHLFPALAGTGGRAGAERLPDPPNRPVRPVFCRRPDLLRPGGVPDNRRTLRRPGHNRRLWSRSRKPHNRYLLAFPRNCRHGCSTL